MLEAMIRMALFLYDIEDIILNIKLSCRVNKKNTSSRKKIYGTCIGYNRGKIKSPRLKI
jgi:hypothetical protein